MSITFENGVIMLESLDELPHLEGTHLFLDLETTSFDESKDAINVWGTCWPLGIAIKVDKSPAYYIALAHQNSRYNLDFKAVRLWLFETIKRCQVWVNHNVKYDYHVVRRRFGIDAKLKKYCTLDLAKLVDSDRFRYSLDALSFDWLHEDISKFENAFKPYLKKSKDYGVIPADVMAPYAGQDVITVSRLWSYIKANMPNESLQLMEMSSELVDCLSDIERNGCMIDIEHTSVAEIQSLNRMSEIQELIAKRTGFSIEPHNSNDCYDLLCNYYGLPVLGYTENGSPSFDKSVIKQYKALPGVDTELIDWMLEFKKLKTFTGLFTSKFLEMHENGLLHCNYNPTVKTGRMSCSSPNMQQNSDEAKALIEPPEEHVIVTIDYSQIEFRMIVHYINDAACIAAYEADPFTDFHNWVKDMIGSTRTPAKTINFLMGYGGGKKKLISSLMLIDELVGGLRSDIEQLSVSESEKKFLFDQSAHNLALQVYNKYHETLPGISRTSKLAMNKIYERGYVINAYGRFRRLNPKVAYRAFNTLCQGSSADLMKERLVAVWKWLKQFYPSVKVIGVIHDEVLFYVPKAELSEHLLDSMCFILENTSASFRVPIRTSCGVSDKNWLVASNSDKPRLFDRKSFQLQA